MSNEENHDVNPDLESSTESEDVEDQDSTDEEESESRSIPYNRFKEVNDKAKKLEEELAQYKSSDNTKTKPETIKQPNSLTREEGYLVAQGLKLEELDKAAKIAELEGVSLLEAVETDIFAAWKIAKENEAKKAEAQLSASNGSRTSRKKKDFNTPGLSKDEHKELWKKSVS
ncbi:MAG: hypothetical protein ACPGYY_10310 [Bacteroidia bacterium]